MVSMAPVLGESVPAASETRSRCRNAIFEAVEAAQIEHIYQTGN